MLLLDLLTWWQSLPGLEQLFWIIGLISNGLFVVYIILQLTGGHDSDFHLDESGAEADAGFAILSLRSLLAFGMFMGYTGVVTLRLGANWFVALLAGMAAGMLAAWLTWRLLRILLRLQTSGTLDLQNAIGQTGEVHLYIPAKSDGAGKVMIELQGALREMEAISEEGEIPTGAAVLVVGLTEAGTLIVQPFPLPERNKVSTLLITD